MHTSQEVQNTRMSSKCTYEESYEGIGMKQVPRNSMYRMLECGLSIAETEWHHRMLIVSHHRYTMVN